MRFCVVLKKGDQEEARQVARWVDAVAAESAGAVSAARVGKRVLPKAVMVVRRSQARRFVQPRVVCRSFCLSFPERSAGRGGKRQIPPNSQTVGRRERDGEDMICPGRSLCMPRAALKEWQHAAPPAHVARLPASTCRYNVVRHVVRYGVRRYRLSSPRKQATPRSRSEVSSADVRRVRQVGIPWCLIREVYGVAAVLRVSMR